MIEYFKHFIIVSCIATRKKKHLPSSDSNVADTFHNVASAPPDDRDYYNLPSTNRNVKVADQSSYVPLSAVGNENRTYSHLNTTAGQ